MRNIRGAGGGGGKGAGGGSSHTPTEAPDSLRSRQYARVLDMVSEGEIEGLVGGLRGVFLDDTPIENNDGTLNFSGVAVDWRNGTQAQTYLPGFPAVESETAVSAEVRYATPIVRQISNQNIDAVRVTISIPQLTYQSPTTGDLGGTSVSIAIDVQDNGGGWQPAKIRTETVGMSFAETTANSGGASILSATMGIAWAGLASGSEIQRMSWDAQYREYGSSAPWTTFASGNFSGAPYINPDPTYWTNGEGSYYRTMSDDGTYDVPVTYEEYVAATTAIAAPVGSATASFTAPVEGAFEFRVIGAGIGGISIASATAYRWTSDDTISGKTTSRYQRAYRIPLEGAGPWDIRVRRTTADSTSSTTQNRTWWESYTEIIDAKLRYPNSAVIGLTVDSSQFRSIPRRGYLIKGMRVRVPANYDPVTRSYTGVWDGTFQTAWSDNPAWCFYDLVTSSRYGLGDFIDADQVDKWSLYDIAQYCDEMVPNGFGGEEPRFTCNLYLQTRIEAFTVINTFASIFRGLAWWSAGAITATADKPSDPVMLFTAANVIDGAFTYSSASLKARHTVALVSWNDPADHYRQKIEYVEDAAGIALYGVIQTEVLAAGCTSRGQAHRLGRWIIYSERLETESISFKCGMDGVYLAPGAVIQTQDIVRAGTRMGGRLLSATVSSLTLDAEITIEAGKTYTLSTLLPDGTLEARAVSSSAGSYSTLSVSPSFTTAPISGAIWILASTDLVPEVWRVLGVTEIDGGILEVTALAHRTDKYSAVEQNMMLEPLQTSGISASLSAPTGLVLSESLYVSGPDVRTQLVASWDSIDGVMWDVSWRYADNNWLLLPRVEVATVTIADVHLGVVEVRVIARNSIGARSPAVSASREILGKTAPPGDIPWFLISGDVLSWGAVADLDLAGYAIRWQPGNSRSWGDAQALHSGLITDSPYTMSWRPVGPVSLLIKAVDTSGNESQDVAAIVTDLGDPLVANVIVTHDYHALGFPGTITGATVEGGSGDLIADADASPMMWSADAAGMWAVDETTLMWSGATYGAMSYVDGYTVDAADAGAQMTLPNTITAISSAINYRRDGTAPMWSAESDPMWTGDVDPMWTLEAWRPWPGAIAAEPVAYEFSVSASAGSTRGRISALAVQLDVPDIVERFDDITIASGGTRLALTNTYRNIKNVSLTLQDDGGSARTVKAMDKSAALGPLIQCLNSAGSGTAGKIDATIQGY